MAERLRLRCRNIFRFRARCAGLRRRYRAGSIPLEAVRASVVSFLGYARQGPGGAAHAADTGVGGVLKHVLKHVLDYCGPRC